MELRLELIKEHLEKCGIEAEIRMDRKEPYVNVGEVKHVKERMQFWAPGYGDSVDMYVGTDMGKWYIQSGKSIYLDSSYRYSYKENKVSFPNINMAKAFISEVTSN